MYRLTLLWLSITAASYLVGRWQGQRIANR